MSVIVPYDGIPDITALPADTKGRYAGRSGFMKKDSMQYVNREHKDTVFRRLFQEKKHLLELYNGLNGTSYENEEDLEITTLDSAIYMGMKNDISFILMSEISLYEHQSSINPNMPLRDLLYIARQ